MADPPCGWWIPHDAGDFFPTCPETGGTPKLLH
jgi:hypothetical protein